jgi:hypothetical protein
MRGETVKTIMYPGRNLMEQRGALSGRAIMAHLSGFPVPHVDHEVA